MGDLESARMWAMALEARPDEVRQLHRDNGLGFCRECTEGVPCTTVRLCDRPLDGGDR